MKPDAGQTPSVPLQLIVRTLFQTLSEYLHKNQACMSRLEQMQRYRSGFWARYMYVNKGWCHKYTVASAPAVTSSVLLRKLIIFGTVYSETCCRKRIKNFWTNKQSMANKRTKCSSKNEDKVKDAGKRQEKASPERQAQEANNGRH